MKIEEKLSVLDQLYAIYDDFMAKQPVCCQKECASCCTRNVAITSLEGYSILERLSEKEKNRILGDLEQDCMKNRFQPKISINQLAADCRKGIDPPDEEINPNWTPCSILSQKVCPIYHVRPFGCRCLSSTADCSVTGYAQMESLIVTVNQVFQQYIEHVDAQGTTGNFLDMLLHLGTDSIRREYRQTGLCQGEHLVSNHPLTCLMVPPEHQEKIQPILAAIQRIRI